jgi:hypothetical protein
VIRGPFGSPSNAGTTNSASTNAARSVIGFPPSGTGQGIAINRRGGPLSFSGQGHEIVQDSPGSRLGGSSLAARSGATGNTFGSRPFEGMRPRGNPPGRIIYWPPFYPGGFYPGFYPGFGFYGGGFGLGFGAFGCDPFSWWGCNNFAYDNFGYYNYYSPYYGFGAPPEPGPSSDYYQQDTPASPASPSSEYTIPYTYEPPPGPQNPPDAQSQNRSAAESSDQGEVVVYLKDGRVYLVRDYWVAGGQLHYRTADGGENTVDWNDIDVQKSVDVNARRGVDFTLRPSENPPPDAAPAPPDAPANPPSNSPAPAAPPR